MQANTSQNLRAQLLNGIIFISDVIGILFAAIYIVFACILIVFGLGNVILKLWLIGVTGIYILLSLVFLFFIGKGRRLKKAFNLFFRYFKYALRIANMFLVFAVLIDMSFGNRLLAAIGIIVLIVSFIVHLFFDIVTLLLKIIIRKVARNYQTAFKEIKTAVMRNEIGQNY